MLARFPRLLVFNMLEPKYTAKLDFLQVGLSHWTVQSA